MRYIIKLVKYEYFILVLARKWMSNRVIRNKIKLENKRHSIIPKKLIKRQKKTTLISKYIIKARTE
jgi:hypothetical protein